MKQREDIVKIIRGELNAIKLRDGRFSISFDESTFMRNCRYLNINVHLGGGFRSLGMIRIQRSLNAAKAIKLVEERLQLFGLDLNKDVITTATDGAYLMVKFGKDTCPEQVTCRRRRRLKGIHSRPDTNRTGAEGLSFYYPRLLYCLDQMLAVMSLSQHRVSSSKTVRPRAPCGARCIGHTVSTWSAVCSEAPHSQFGEGARPHLCMDEWNRPIVQ